MKYFTIQHIPDKYKCCFDEVNKEKTKSLFNLEKYYFNNIIDKIYKFYEDKKNYDKTIKKKFLYLHKIYSLYYLKRFELEYCIDNFDILGYLKSINCIKEDNTINCLYKDMECCDDNELYTLCKCEDIYPLELPDINVTLEITGFVNEKFTNLKNALNYNLLAYYRCCNGEGISLDLPIISNVPIITNIVFNNNSFDSITHFSNDVSHINSFPYTEEVIIRYKYCDGNIVYQKVIFNYITNCKSAYPSYVIYGTNQTTISGSENVSEIKQFNLFTSSLLIILCCNKSIHTSSTVEILSYNYDPKYHSYLNINSVYYLSGDIYIDYKLKGNLINLNHFTKISKCKYKLDIPIQIKLKICEDIIDYTATLEVIYNTDEIYDYEIKTLLVLPFITITPLPHIIQNNATAPFTFGLINWIGSNSCCDGTCDIQIKYHNMILKVRNGATTTDSGYINLIDISGSYITSLNITSPKTMDINLIYGDEVGVVFEDDYDCYSGYALSITLNVVGGNLYFSPDLGEELDMYIDYSIYICGKEFKFLKKVLIIK